MGRRTIKIILEKIVELRGVEPRSKRQTPEHSTCLVCYLIFGKSTGTDTLDFYLSSLFSHGRPEANARQAVITGTRLLQGNSQNLVTGCLAPQLLWGLSLRY